MISQDAKAKLAQWRQYSAIATAFTLPISTSGQNVAIAVFAILAIATMDPARYRQAMRMPAGWLPIALFALIVAGTLWSVVPMATASKGISAYAKLLLIPIVLATPFSRREGIQIGYGFVAGCAIVAILSYAHIISPYLKFPGTNDVGIPFKDNAVQSETLALAAFGLAIGASHVWNKNRKRAIAMLVVAGVMFTNIFLILISKTGVMVAAALLAIVIIHLGGWRRTMLLGTAAIVLAVTALSLSPQAQRRITEISNDVTALRTGKEASVSTGSRVDFYHKAVEFFWRAPLIGHGTGSIRSLYQAAEADRPSPYGQAVHDPHNQVLHTALQVGVIGAILLIAMWVAHARLFLDGSFASMMGLGLLAMVLIGSLFNSHISQVTQGMLYCTGVGLCGSIILSRRRGDLA